MGADKSPRKDPVGLPEADIPYKHQISLDVPRAFPTMEHWSDEKRQSMQVQLTAVLEGAMVACRDAGLECHYYQGLHAIAVVLLCQLGQHRATLCLTRLLHGPLRGFAAASMELTTALLGCLMPLLQQEDSAVHTALLDAGIQEFFALPWVITWFAHCEHNVARVAPVFDFCMGCGNPAAPIYLSAALVLRHTSHITQATDEADMHAVIRHLHEGVDWPQVVSHATAMYQRLPPAQLLLLSSPEQQATIAAEWPQVAQSPPDWHAATMLWDQLPSTAAAVGAGHGGVSQQAPPAPPSPSRQVLRAWKSGDKLRRGWGSRGEDAPSSPLPVEASSDSAGAAPSAEAGFGSDPVVKPSSGWKRSRWDALLFLAHEQTEGTFSSGPRGCVNRCIRPTQYAIVRSSAEHPCSVTLSPNAANHMLLEIVQPSVFGRSAAVNCFLAVGGTFNRCPGLIVLLLMVCAAIVVSGALVASAVDGIAPNSVSELLQHLEL